MQLMVKDLQLRRLFKKVPLLVSVRAIYLSRVQAQVSIFSLLICVTTAAHLLSVVMS